MGFLKGVEVVTLKLTKQDFEELYNNDSLPYDYEIKQVEPFDESYPDDPVWLKLKKQSTDAFKLLKEYEFNKRHK
jgi:hypothetical protein